MSRLDVAALVGVVVLACAQIMPTQARASQRDAWTEAARVSGVPIRILQGIALVESGKKWSDGLYRPWPWTLNSPARGAQFFTSREEAERGLKELLSQGVRNVDIGLMQINCRYHCDRVKAPTDLFDPKVNLQVASAILSEVRLQRPDLAGAVGAYHAGLHPSREVRSVWYQNEVARRVRSLTATKQS